MMKLIVSREQAQQQGLLKYYTGIPCSHGHLAERYVSGKNCVECLEEHGLRNRDQKRKAERAWALRNPERNRLKGKLWRRKQRVKQAGRPRPEVCDVCGRGGKICFDHCHTTGAFRGWLCNFCNVIIGLAEDNPELLKKLVAYLEAKRMAA